MRYAVTRTSQPFVDEHGQTRCCVLSSGHGGQLGVDEKVVHDPAHQLHSVHEGQVVHEDRHLEEVVKRLGHEELASVV
jgi:hypothetical protein